MPELRKQPNRISYDNTKDYSEFCSTIPNKRVLVYIPSGTESIPSRTLEGVFELLWDCTTWQKYGFEFIPVVGNRMPLPNARTTAVEFAIENNCGYILWMDDDMIIMPGTNAFSNLLLQDKDVVAPLFYTRMWPHLPCLFNRKYRAQNRFCTFENILDYPKGELLKVDGVGFGLVLTKMEVFKKTAKPWFIYSDTFGEDLYFCSKAIDAGVEIYVDTSYSVGHLGVAPIISESTFDLVKPAAIEYARQKVANGETLSKKYELDCDIIMPCYHNFKLTKDAIESIFNNSHGVTINMILINDGNDKDLAKYFERISKARPNVKVITNDKNIGWVKAVNQGLEHTKSHYILITNNDIEVWPQYNFWLSVMINELMCDDKLGAVGPKSDFIMGIQNVQSDGFIKLQRHYAKFLIGFCFMIKKSVVDQIGKMDEIFGIGGNDDLDWSIAIRKAGYNLKVLRDVFIHHEGFQSLGMVFKDYKEIEDITRPLLIEKWGNDTVEELFKVDENFLVTGKEKEKL